MRQLLIFTIFYFASLGITYCQETSPLDFIKPEISRYFDSEKVVYTDRIDEMAYQSAKDNIRKKQYFSPVEHKKIAFQFTKNERQYILQQLKFCTKSFLPDSLFSNSKMISLDSFTQYFKIKNNAKRRIFPLIDTPGFSREFRLALIKENNRRNWVLIFSKPIYIRNKSLAILYLEPRCGWDCGGDELAVYKKINGKWEKWLYIFDGAF